MTWGTIVLESQSLLEAGQVPIHMPYLSSDQLLTLHSLSMKGVLIATQSDNSKKRQFEPVTYVIVKKTEQRSCDRTLALFSLGINNNTKININIKYIHKIYYFFGNLIN